MSNKLTKLAMTCAALMLSAATLPQQASAESANATWVGPNGGVVHWHGDGYPGHYRGTVVVKTPDGRTFRRVTNVRRGPHGVFASRKWIGPDGAVAYRAGGARY